MSDDEEIFYRKEFRLRPNIAENIDAKNKFSSHLDVVYICDYYYFQLNKGDKKGLYNLAASFLKSYNKNNEYIQGAFEIANEIIIKYKGE